MKEEKVLLEKLLKCAYVIIALLAINTLLVFIANIDSNDNKSTKTTTSEGTEETATDYDVSMMNAVDMDGLMDLFNSEDTQVVYLGRETCGYCVKFLPTLQKAQEDYGYKTNYLDITTVSEDDVNKLLEKDNEEGFLKENYGATPMVILVRDGKMVDTWVGYSEYDSFAQFLEKNNFKK